MRSFGSGPRRVRNPQAYLVGLRQLVNPTMSPQHLTMLAAGAAPPPLLAFTRALQNTSAYDDLLLDPDPVAIPPGSYGSHQYTNSSRAAPHSLPWLEEAEAALGEFQSPSTLPAATQPAEADQNG